MRGPIAIDGDVQFLVKRPQALHVIGMFVRVQDAAEILRPPADGRQPLAELPQAESRVNQHAGLIGLYVGAIAPGTAAQNSQANRHGLP